MSLDVNDNINMKQHKYKKSRGNPSAYTTIIEVDEVDSWTPVPYLFPIIEDYSLPQTSSWLLDYRMRMNMSTFKAEMKIIIKKTTFYTFHDLFYLTYIVHVKQLA